WRFRVRYEGRHPARLRVPDPDPALPSWIPVLVRHTVPDVDHVLGVDEDNAGPAELRPHLEQISLLIEDLDAVVAAVRHDHAAPRIDLDVVRVVELAGIAAARIHTAADLEQELAVPGELDDPVVPTTVA